MPDPLSLIEAMSETLRALFVQRGIHDPALVGIHTGGVWVAQHLREKLAVSDPLGCLDIGFYRDDFSRIGMNPEVKPSDLPFDVEGRHLVLVDDVLYTGRTVRAALNEIFDYGRPDSVILAMLVDRGGRELPIQPDVVGTRIDLYPDEDIKLSGPNPLSLSIRRRT